MLGRFRFLGLRLLEAVPVVFGLTIIIFLLVRLLPGDPALAVLGDRATEQSIAALHEQWGLDDPLWQQYLLFLGRLLRGDLGYSYYYRTDVASLIAASLPVTLTLVLYTIVLTLLVSVPASMYSAARPNGFGDQLIRVVSLFGLGMPHFWVGIMLILLFAVRLPIFPVGGLGDSPLEDIRFLFLPALTLTIGMAPMVVRSLRTSMLNIVSKDYILTARMTGAGTGRVLRRHVLRNAFIPTVSVLSVNVGYMVGGSVVTEKIFSIPGVGSLMLNAIFNRDFMVVQSVTLILALVVIGVGIIADIAQMLLDPTTDLTKGR